MDMTTLALAKAYTDEKCGGTTETVKTVLYEGTPTKMNLTDYGVGFAYLCSPDDLPGIAKGDCIHYQCEINGVTHSGVLDECKKNDAFNALLWVDASYTFQLIFVGALGGTGFMVTDNGGPGKDVGDIKLKLWAEYNENDVYLIHALYDSTAPSKIGFAPFSHDKAVAAAKKGLLQVNHDNGADDVRLSSPVQVRWFKENSVNVFIMYCWDVINNGSGIAHYSFNDGKLVAVG